MSYELAKAFVRIRADSSQLAGDLEEVKQQVTSSMTAIAASAAAMLGGAAFGLGTILSSGMEVAGNLEEATVTLETLLGSAKAAKDMLAELTDFAVKTPFEMPQLLDVAIQMINANETADETMKTIKMLGDASGGTALKFGLLATVFNQIRGAGHLLTQDFRQLSTRGILSLQDIAKHFKVTDAEASKMISNGKIGFEDVRAILEGMTSEGGKMANMMEKQSTTLNGLWTTLKDATGILHRELAGSLLPAMKAYRTIVIDITNKSIEWIQTSKGIASGALVGAKAFAVMGAAMLGAFAVGKLTGISFFTLLVGGSIAAAVIAVGAGIGAMVMHTINWLKETNEVNGLLDTIIGQFDEIKQLALEIGRNILEAFSNLDLPFDTWAEGIAQFVSVVLGELNKILDWFSLLTTNWDLTTQYLELKFKLAVFQMGRDIDAVVEGLKTPFIALGETIKQIFMDVGKVAKQVFMEITNPRMAFGGIRPAKLPNVDIGKNAADAFEKASKRGSAAKGIKETFFDSVEDILNQELQKLLDKMRAARKEKRLEIVDITEEKIPQIPLKKRTPSPSAEPKFPIGRFGLEEFGKKLQDMLYKDKTAEGIQLQQLAVQQASKKTQDHILEALKKQEQGALKLS